MTGLWMKYNFKRMELSSRVPELEEFLPFFGANSFLTEINNWNISLSSMAALESIFHNLDDVYDGGRNIKTILTSLLTLQLSDKMEENFRNIFFVVPNPQTLHHKIRDFVVLVSPLMPPQYFPWKSICHAFVDAVAQNVACLSQNYMKHAMHQFFSSCASTFWDHSSWWRLLETTQVCGVEGLMSNDRSENFHRNKRIYFDTNIVVAKPVVE